MRYDWFHDCKVRNYKCIMYIFVLMLFNLNADCSDTGYTKLVSFYKFKCEVKSGENYWIVLP